MSIVQAIAKFVKVWNSIKINELILDPESGYGEQSGPVFMGTSIPAEDMWQVVVGGATMVGGRGRVLSNVEIFPKTNSSEDCSIPNLPTYRLSSNFPSNCTPDL